MRRHPALTKSRSEYGCDNSAESEENIGQEKTSETSISTLDALSFY